MEYLAAPNENPKPFVWTASGDLILERVKKVCERSPNSGLPIVFPLSPLIGHLVTRGHVHPNPARNVNVACSHHADFAGTHAGKPLKFDHCPDLSRHMGPNGVHMDIGDGPDGLRFLGVGATLLEPADGFDGLVDAGGNQFLG